ncbi:hypothetical protein PENSPDRAFT_659978 [Peniophora sp. CONT]|nr:hypothetical protein PENSPDRAFT_659978 [Peniophora sp. CONT]
MNTACQNMRKAQGSNVRSSTHADITETTSISAETQQLLLTLQNSETLSAVLAQPPGSYSSIDPVTNADARTPNVDTSHACGHLSVAAKFEGQSPIAASSAHTPVLKSILKSSPASSTRRDLATAELNRALHREDKLQEELGNTRKELYGALDELKAQKQQSDLARRQLEEESERKTRKLEVFKHELDELKQQIEESEATKRELERKLKRQGEEHMIVVVSKHSPSCIFTHETCLDSNVISSVCGQKGASGVVNAANWHTRDNVQRRHLASRAYDVAVIQHLECT